MINIAVYANTATTLLKGDHLNKQKIKNEDSPFRVQSLIC
jgi:hypothetical protein